MQGRFAVALGLVAVVSTACTITVTKDANGPSTHAAAPSVSAASPTPSDVSAVKPKQPNSAARVEGKFQGGGLFTDTVTMVPRCRGGGECDVVAQ